MSGWVEEGQQAPDFTLQTDRGEPLALSSLRGRPVVLYFYPKDDTPGCTREACAFRDRRDEIAAHGATVLGVSPDDVASPAAFRDKYALDFPLLADPGHRVAETYGAWRERERDGRRSFGIQRSTFLIDAEGTVRRVWRTVDVSRHDGDVLAALGESS